MQHATAQFHLGQALLQAGAADDAVTALLASLEWFPEPLQIERAKVLNLLGAGYRATGQLDAAARCFIDADRMFAAGALRSERGAAMFNLGLVLRDKGDPAAAAASFAQAQDQFTGGPIAVQSSAAIHLGMALLDAGDPDGAAEALERGLELAKRAGERESVGVAANTLGLAQLACERVGAAVDSFGLAVAAHPRSVRPTEFAMAKANLALAYEGAGDMPRARLAARQALAVADPPAAVQAQAAATLRRLGSGAGSDLLAVLDDEPPQEWVTVVREELTRWAAVAATERLDDAAAWVCGQWDGGRQAGPLAQAFLAALIELPPADLDVVIVALLEATRRVDEEMADTFRSTMARTMALLPVPQLLRLRDRFRDLSAELGQEASWS